MDRKTVVKRIEVAIEASAENVVMLAVGTWVNIYRVSYNETSSEYSFDEKTNKDLHNDGWVTHESGDTVNELVPWLRACIGQFKEPIWDTLLPDTRKKASVI